MRVFRVSEYIDDVMVLCTGFQMTVCAGPSCRVLRINQVF